MKRPVMMLVGTDWWTDCDDAVAMRVLSWAQKRGMIEILGIAINACMDYSVVSLDAFLRSEGLSDIELGIDHQADDFGGSPPYQKRLAELPSKYAGNADCEDAVRLYRRKLHEAEGQVDIIEIGYPQVLANTLMSEPDDISVLSGVELVSRKVKKLWMMAGKWDDLENGRENNFARNQRSRIAGDYLCRNWPTPITFLGWEIGNMIRTGGELRDGDILRQVLIDHGSPNGRSSWDPMLALLACVSDEKEAGYSTVQGTASVNPQTGINSFVISESGNHCFVKKDLPDDFYKKAINDIINISC